MKKELATFKKYVIDHKKAILFLILFALFTYGIKLFNYSISIDTEVIINIPNSLFRTWIEIGRPCLVVLKKIFMLHPFNPIISVELTYALFISFTIFLYYIFYRIKPTKSNENLAIFGSILLGSAIYMEQLNFTLQSAEVAFGLNLLAIGIILFCLGMDSKKKKYYFLGFLCTAFSFGIYQSLIVIFITMIALIMLIKIKNNQLDWKSTIKFLCITAGLFLLSFIGYVIGNKLSMVYINGVSNSYLTSQIHWFKEPILTTIQSIGKIIYNGYFGAIKGNRLFYGYINILAILFVFVYIINIFLKKEKNKSLKIFASLIILFAPFLLTILMGTSEAYRAQLALPIVIALIITFFKDQFANFKYGKTISIFFIIVLIAHQTILTNRLLVSDYYRYVDDVNYANLLYQEISKYDLHDKRVVMLGSHTPTSPLITTKGEVMGYSFFEWDRYERYGVGVRAGNFMKSLGYEINVPNEEDYKIAKQFEEELEVFPTENSIMEYQDLVIVKLSD